LAASLGVLGIALAPPAGATADATSQEVSGATRYGTAAAAAGEAFPGGTTCAIIATGENFPDVLAAGGLAGAEGCALLLVQQHDITDETAAAIDDLGVTDCTIVGGPAAVGQDVEDGLGDLCGTVDRIAGNDRYETASDIADQIGGAGTCYVASGEVAADAQVVSAAAFDQQAPVLLVTANDIPSSTEGNLGDCTDVQIVGGTGRISDANQGDIDDASNDADGSDRLAGNNRQETAVEVANYERDTLGWGVTCVALVAPRAPSGNIDMSPDALTGSQLAGAQQCPELFVEDTDTLGDAAGGFISDNADTIDTVYKIGGDAAIDDSVADDAVADAQEGETPTTNTTVTSRPELVSASMTTVTASQATPAQPVGTYVTYTFDEPITGASPAGSAALFHLYNADRTVPGTATSVASSTTDNKSVIVRFASLTTASSVANITLATVDAGAVVDAGGAPGFTSASTAANPEGDAPLGAGTGSAAAGVTLAPDLLSVGNFRTGASPSPGSTVVDFTFDQAATVIGTAGYQLIPTVNPTTGFGQNAVTCEGPGVGSTAASGGTSPGGNNTTVITVTCVNTSTDITLSAANFSRGVVVENTVQSSTGQNNPMEAVDISNGGITDGPDLVTAIFAPDATVGFDNVVYVFDENVQIATDATKFNVYRASGAQVDGITSSPGTVSPVRSPENNSAVSVRFTDGVLADSVGASVDPTAVFDLQNLGNLRDEEAVAPASSTGVTPGRTAGPDLIGVRSEDASIPGFVTGRKLIYVFDIDVDDTSTVASKLVAYTADGIRMTCTSAASLSPSDQTQRPEETDNEVACTAFTLATGGSATVAQIGNAVLGAVDDGAVTAESGGLTNPEGSEVITGSNGTPAS